MRKPLITTFLLLLLSQTALAELVIVVNQDSEITYNRTHIARLFLGKTTTLPDGQRVIPINLPEHHPLRLDFQKHVLRRSSRQLKTYWARKMFTGKAMPPQTLKNEDAILAWLNETPDGIAYISSGKVNNSVKVIARFR